MDIILNQEQQEEVARQVKRLRRNRMAARRHRKAKAMKRAASLVVCFFIVFSLALHAGLVKPSSASTLDNSGQPPMNTISVLEAPVDVIPEPIAEPELQSFAIPAVQTDFKTFMDYRTITSKSSVQWQMQQEAETDNEGFRIWNSYYMVAMGTYYAPYCGRIFSVTLSSGRVFQCVVADIKADKDTDDNNQHRNGNIIEFIVDGDQIPDICWKMGDMSWAPEADMRGDVEKIELVYSPY